MNIDWQEIADPRLQRRRQARAIAILVVTIAAGMGAILYGLHEVARTQPPKVVIDPASLPAIRPGSQ